MTVNSSNYLKFDARWVWIIPAVFLAFALFAEDELELLWPTFLAATVAASLLWANGHRLLSVFSVSVVSHLIIFPMAAFLNYLGDGLAVREDLWPESSLAMWGCVVGLTGLGMGLLASRLFGGAWKPIKLVNNALFITSRKFNWSLTLIVVLVALIHIISGTYYHGSIGSFNFEAVSYLNTLHHLLWIGYLGMFLQLYRWTQTRAKTDLFALFVMVSIAVGVYVPSGARYMAIGFIPLLGIFYLSWDRNFSRNLAVTIAAAIFGVFVSIVMDVYRNTLGVSAYSMFDKFSLLADASSTSSINTTDDGGGNIILGRLSEFSAVGRIIATTPEFHPFTGMDGVEDWWQIWIPKVWRPAATELFINDGAVTALRYGISPGESSSAPITIIGDLFVRFGWPGIFLGMTMLGFSFASLDSWLAARDLEHWKLLAMILICKSAWYCYATSALGIFMLLTRDMILLVIIARVLSYVAERFRDAPGPSLANAA